MKHFRVSLSAYIEALRLCAEDHHVDTVLERSELLNIDKEEGLLLLTLRDGPVSVIEAVLESERQLKDFCSINDIEFQNKDTKTKLIKRISECIFERNRLKGFSIIKRYINIVDERNILEITMNCVTDLESLIVDMYKLYIGDILYSHIKREEEDDDDSPILNTMSLKRIDIRTALDQIAKYDNELRDASNFFDPLKIKHEDDSEHKHKTDAKYRNRMNIRLEFQNEIRRLNNQEYILGQENISIINKIFEIRNKLFHSNEYLHDEKPKRARELLEHANKFLDYAINYLPRIILPTSYSRNEFGFRYISYVDEDDMDVNGEIQISNNLYSSKRLYLIEDRGEFYPYQKAYCLYPNRLSTMRDPKLYYIHNLHSIKSKE